eukprot:gene11528-biopygen9684
MRRWLSRPLRDRETVGARHDAVAMLIDDGSYFLVEQTGRLAGCGGWSHRATLYGGDHSAALRDARALMAAPERTPSARVLDSIVQSHQPDLERQADNAPLHGT